MVWTKLHWVAGPWPGKLALAARPRGGDWLPDEIASWQQNGVDTICSLLTSEEERDLDIAMEKTEAQAHGMEFVSCPIPDRQVPNSKAQFGQTLQILDRDLAFGRNVVLHCRQGIGRTGLVAACLLLTKGIDSENAIRQLSEARGIPVPETSDQRLWIEQYADSIRKQ